MEEARLWRSRYAGELPPREADFLDAVIELGTRATRRKRRAVIAAFALLGSLTLAAGAGIVMIREAQQGALEQKERAERNAADAKRSEAAAQEAKRAAEESERIAKQKQAESDENFARYKKENERALTAEKGRAQEAKARAEQERLTAAAAAKAARES